MQEIVIRIKSRFRFSMRAMVDSVDPIGDFYLAATSLSKVPVLVDFPVGPAGGVLRRRC